MGKEDKRREQLPITASSSEAVMPERPVGDLVRELQTKYGLSQRSIAKTIGVTAGNVSHLIHNRISITPPVREGIRRVLASYLHDPLAKQIEERFRQDEANEENERRKQFDNDWLRTIDNASFANGLRYLYVAEGLNRQEFHREAGLTKESANKFCEKNVIPRPHVLNQIIENSCIDANGLAAQRLRLKRSDISPMTTEQLKQCSLGEFLLYVRNLRGFSLRDAAKQIDIRFDTVRDLETSRRRVVVPKIDERIIRFLGLDVDSDLAQIIRHKESSQPPESLSEATITNALSEGYLFATHIDLLPAYRLPSGDKPLYESLKRQKISSDLSQIGQAIRTYRSVYNLSQRQLGARLGIDQSAIHQIERGKLFSKDRIIARICRDLGYDSHHPITHLMFDFALEDRKRRKDTRSGDIFVAN